MKTWHPGAKRDWLTLAMIVAGVPLLLAAVVETWPKVYAFLVAHPFFLLYFCGGLALTLVCWLIWHESRPLDTQVDCCADWGNEK